MELGFPKRIQNVLSCYLDVRFPIFIIIYFTFGKPYYLRAEAVYFKFV
jgi:hypothetical protein